MAKLSDYLPHPPESTSTLDEVTTEGNVTTNDITVGNLTSTGIDDNANATAITIDATGDVGIGTDTPLYTSTGRTGLTVNGNTSANLVFGRSKAPAHYLLSDASGLTIGDASGGILYITAAGVTQVTGGFEAAQPGASSGAFAAGLNAGLTSQGINATAVGNSAGYSGQGGSTVAVGVNAGQTSQGTSAVAVGNAAGKTSQSTGAVAVGEESGLTTQGESAVAMGRNAGQNNQGEAAVGLGRDAGYTGQGANAVAVGRDSGKTNQSGYTVAVGVLAGESSQGESAVSIGNGAGRTNQGANSVAIGKQAGLTNQGANGIIISSRGTTENNADDGHILIRSTEGYLFLDPVADAWTFNGGDLVCTDNVTAYSDERLKSDIETLDGSKVYNMRGVSFTKDGEAGSGVIAQELQKVAPELVHEGGEYLSVAYGNLVGYLIEAVKDLKAEVEELKRAK